MMSRRYGRNQKRKHREQIAGLQQSYGLAKRQIDSLASELMAVKGTITEMCSIIRAVSEYSIALSPVKVAGHRQRDYHRIAPRCFSFNDVFSGDIHASDIAYRTVDLYALRVFLESRREAFQAAVHLEYSAGGHSAYMISEDGLRSIPREALIKRVAPDVARLLVDHFRR